MVKISVISVEGIKEDNEKKGQKLPEPESLTDIPLYEKLKLETIDDLASVKNPRKRCKGLAIILVLIVLVITCLCLATVIYTRIWDKQEEHAKQETHRFECDIMFRDPDDAVPGRQVNPTTSSFSTLNSHLHHMKEEIIVNVENNTEVFSIPASDDHEAIMILHDFDNEYTAYLLIEEELCFVKDIHPFLMSPFVFLRALWNPLYFLEEYFVTRDNFIAVPPPLGSLSMYGAEIDSMCGSVPTFWLEEMNDEYETVDITELPWGEWGYPEWSNRRRRSVKEKLKKIQYFSSDELVHDMTIAFKNPFKVRG